MDDLPPSIQLDDDRFEDLSFFQEDDWQVGDNSPLTVEEKYDNMITEQCIIRPMIEDLMTDFAESTEEDDE